MPYSLPRPLWGEAIANAFQQGTASAGAAISAKRERQREEERREEERRRQNAVIMLQTPGATNDPNRQPLQAPSVRLPAQPGQAGPGAMLEGVTRAFAPGIPAPQGRLVDGARDLGEGVAEELGFRYIDRTQTPEYQENMQELRASAAPLMSFTDRNVPTAELDRGQLLEAISVGTANQGELNRTRDLENTLAMKELDFATELAKVGLSPEQFIAGIQAGDPAITAYAERLSPGLAGLAGQMDDRYNDSFGLEQYDARTRRMNAESASRAASASGQGKPDIQFALTLPSAIEAHGRLSELDSGPGFGSVLGEGLAGLIGIGGMDGPMRRWGMGANARQIQEDANAFTEGILRKMTGAAINDSEFDRYAQMFVPQSFDNAESLARKTIRRQNVLDTMMRMANLGYTEEQIQAAITGDYMQFRASGASQFMGSVGDTPTRQRTAPGAPLQSDSGEGYVPLFPDNQWIGQ